MLRRATAALLISVALLWVAASAALAGAGSLATLKISAPRQVESGASAALTVTLPANVAAVDGRIFFDTSAAEVVGVSANKHAIALTPQQISNGFAFGVYGMAGSTATKLSISVSAFADGQLPFRVVLDSAGDASGHRVALAAVTATGTLHFGTATNSFAAPAAVAPRFSSSPLGLTRDLIPDGRVAVTDLDVVRAGWESTHATDNPCAAGADSITGADANGDGCVDVLDVQAVLANQSWNVVNGLAVSPASKVDAANTNSANAAVVTGATFTVNSANDAVDAHPGDGICADSTGRCTLRAAITESNWASGANTVNFNIAGTAPVTIQLSTRLPELLLQDRTGGTLVDGYSEPGSRVNTSATASNAIPGVYVVGTGNSPQQNAFRITSAFNTVRGIVFQGNSRTIVLDGVDAHDNLIAGNWLNYFHDGSVPNFKGHYNIWISNGANHNHIGTPALADRNVSGTATKGAAMYGPGTDFNVIQNNLLCMTPSGTSTATCDVGTDYTFGPKNNLIGGPDPGDGNVYGASTQQCIEFAHQNGQNNDDTYKNEHNSIINNWLGFRADGSYSSAFRCGSNNPSNNSNDSNAINLADGSSYNIVQGNYIGTWHDGVNIEMPNETGNIVSNNIIGLSPKGEAAPYDRYGVGFRVHAHDHQIIGNTIYNAGVYGIAINGSDITHITISKNIINNMTGTAIFLQSGANGGVVPPVITNATTAQVSGTGEVGDTVEVFKASRNAGQSGLPIAYVGSAVVAADHTWSATVSDVSTGDRVTATQTRAEGSTSALSSNVTATFQQGPPPGTLAVDAFGRTVANGWGSADTGGVYTIQGQAISYSVGSGAGTININAGASRAALLNSTSVQDTDVVFRVAANKVAAGGTYIVYGIARKSGTNEYRAKLIFTTTGGFQVQASKLVSGSETALGSAVTVSGLSQSAGGYIWVHAQFNGVSPTTINIRAWASGQSEPSAWQFTATDSTSALQGAGSVGLRLFLASKVSNGPVGFTFDDYAVTDLTP